MTSLPRRVITVSEIVQTPVSASADPSMILTFQSSEGEEVTLTLTLTASGDVRTVWEQLADMGEREALHHLAGEMFQDITRDVS